MNSDWQNAIVIDPRQLQALEEANQRLRAEDRKRTLGTRAVAVTAVVLAFYGRWEASRANDLDEQLVTARVQVERAQGQVAQARADAERTSSALQALTRTQENILQATEQAPTVGKKSWGRRFTVTKYLPNDPSYGKFNDGLTATLTKADPSRRIVAVDPALIPYGSWVWIEDLGWYHAEDCGGAIKGFRLDVLAANMQEATQFGRKDRFVLVVPPANV